METTTQPTPRHIEIRENFTGLRGKPLKAPILEIWVDGEQWTRARNHKDASKIIRAIQTAGAGWYDAYHR